MKLAPHVRPLCWLLSMTTLAVWLFGPTSAFGGVFDDAKFKLDLRGGDPNSNDFVDSGEVVNAINPAQTAVLGGGQGPSKITADKYASGGYESYGELPHVADIEVMNPANGATYTQKGLVLPQSKKTVDGSAYWSENGIVFTQGRVLPGNDGYVTLYVRFKWGGNTSGPNFLFGNGWDGAYGNADNGISIYITGGGGIGLVGGGSMPESTLKISANVWYDLFVKVRNEEVDGAELAVAGITLYKANANVAPTMTAVTHTHTRKMQYSSSKTSIPFGCYLTANGWGKKTNPRAFRGQIADAMIWDRALTDAEMAEVVAGPPALGGEWQIGAVNGSADEFDDAAPAAVYDVQSMPWRRMRKTLDSTNPSLSISTTMTADDVKRNRTLTLTPILSGASSAPVEVALNGTVVGSIDLASETSITLPRQLWLHGSGLANTITVTRTAPLSGTVQLDAVSLATGDYGETGSVLEDATFKLDLRGGESTYTQPGVLGNALDFSAASPLAGYMGDQRGPQTYNANFGNLPAQETADVQNPYYPYTTNSQTVLHFYQDFKGEDKGSVNSGVVIPGAAPKGLVQTYYLRFRWDGEAPAKTGGDDKSAPVYILQSGQSSNGNNVNNGVAINLNGITVKGTTTNAVLACRVGASGTSRYPEMTATISAGKWVDAFVTFEANADNTGFTTTFSVCSPSPTGGNFNPPSLVTQVVSSSGGLSFDSTNLSLGLYHDSANTRSTTRCFRGLIADFMTWERTLTDAEKIEVMSGRHGAKWMVGAANGSAEEFTDDDPAAVFEPESMPWRRMRRTLTAANPALALQSPLAAHEAGRAMLFTLVPVPDGAAHPVRVAVNGTVVGDFDAATDGTIVIPRGSWARDGSGDVTVTATSLNTSAPLSIDAIALSGSWQNAPDGGGSNGMVNERYSPRVAFAGDTDVDHFTSSMSVGNSSTNYTFGVWVPKGMGDKVGWKFRTKTTSRSDPIDGLDARHVVYVNGTAVGLHDGWFEENEAFTLDIPAGVLHDGMNYVQWVQTLPTREAQQALVGRPGVFQYYDYWGMTLVPPTSPFMIVVR